MGELIRLPKRRRKPGRKPTKPPSCPVYDLASYRPAISPEALYHRAAELDENPETYDVAERLYREAIRLRPDYALAITNLGNVRYRCNDPREARELYRRALEADPNQPEAHYNLGYVLLEQEQTTEAVVHLNWAVRLDPSFADAYYNLAMALEQVGCFESAQPHWRSYLRLVPTGSWADIARRHLTEDTQPKLRLVR